uniref:heavy metal-binding domain-containing protein n=1 Tax=Accumulibacter sp. TaxID=2053492 RepID=UPI002615FCBB
MNTKTGSNGHHDHHHQREHSHAAHGAHESHSASAAADLTTVKDPVCGMSVALGAGKPSFEHDGKTWHFCSQKCHDRFAADPAHYLTGAHKAQSPAAPAGTQYTCPMHPEIVRDAPGDCPKCGMALEPMGVPTGDEGPNPELVDFRRRFSIAAVLTVPLLVLTMGPLLGLGFVREALGERAALWIELLLATPVVL